jgi:putative ATP-binding cassette transporter
MKRMKLFDREFLRSTWQLTRTYWYSEEKWQARGLLAAIVVLNLGHVYILVRINEWRNTFYNALQNYDISGFWSSLGDFSQLAFAGIVVGVYQIYLRQMLGLKWRRWLTERYLQRWLEHRTYYRMRIVDNSTDNPDQRISEDLQMFTTYTLQLSLGILNAAVTLGSFMFILWRLSGTFDFSLGQYAVSIPGYMLWVAVAYAGIGTWITTKIGKPLIGLNFEQQRYEADFRFSLVRLRENSESIALYSGEQQEQSNFTARFQKVFGNFWQLMRRQKQLTWFTNGYGQIAIIFPFLVAAPRYFRNEIQLGGLIQISTAFGQVQDSLSYIVDSYSQIAEWRAVVNRLVGFTRNMEKVGNLTKPAEQQVEITSAGDSSFTVNGLDICLPDGRCLLQQINLVIMPGDSLLITGPSGCGKSTLIRTLAGIWPFGQGSVAIPQGQRVLFLPQKSYLPLGTLRDVLLYPYIAADAINDTAIEEVMTLCKLEGLTEKLDEVADWSQILSLGEQQRVAFVRVLLQKPAWLFMDEATAALDEDTEELLYNLLQERLKDTAIISVGHRMTLNAYHNKKFSIDENGTWSLLC